MLEEGRVGWDGLLLLVVVFLAGERIALDGLVFVGSGRCMGERGIVWHSMALYVCRVAIDRICCACYLYYILWLQQERYYHIEVTARCQERNGDATQRQAD